MREFRWVPGQGMDRAALARMAKHFHRPDEPMGEAWFMGDQRKMFPELLGDLDAIPVAHIQHALVEICSGYGAFGPMEEWDVWFHYLLPRVLPRAHDGGAMGAALETLISCCIAIYPNGIRMPPYEAFREDALQTIGRTLMDPACWKGAEISVGKLLHPQCNPSGTWGWWNASGDFSASMVFCLKYLPAELVAGWIRSVLQITSAHWRAQVIVWAVGLREMLEGKVKWPADWKENARSTVSWDWSHCLRADIARRDGEPIPRMDALLSDSAREDVLEEFRKYFSNDIWLEWLESISEVDYLEAELAEIPATFESLYVGKPAGRIILP